MNQNRICIVREPKYSYPTAADVFRPSVCYPEYPYQQDISRQDNHVYAMVREGLYLCGMDQEHYGLPQWNPLGEFIQPGNRVLIKPNLVLHENLGGYGEECLYTQPSVVAAMIDYVIIALKGSGTIVIGDAPLQECVFDTLLEKSGYGRLIEYYAAKGIDIKITDFRNTKTYVKDGIHYLQTVNETDHGTIVQMDQNSLFAGKSEKELKNLRITNYDPRILQKHHNSNRHEYNISSEVLAADVIINVPKPKTHRKAGITGALKNLIGINANKEYLPHHTLGSSREGGDAYQNSSRWLSFANYLLDQRNIYNHDGKNRIAKKCAKAFHKVYQKGRRIAGEKYWEGSWYGNDTIWRTIVDLNRIMLYADKNGIMTDSIQRKTFIVCDMIISGEKEGPLEPSPKDAGIILFGRDPVCMDQVISVLMGFDYKKIPSLSNREMYKGQYAFTEHSHIEIVSNHPSWDRKEPAYILQNSNLGFIPTMGWEERLGNPEKQILCETIRKSGRRTVIFGAGKRGTSIADYLLDHGIKVEKFCDNAVDMQGKNVWRGIRCTAPENLDASCFCVVTTPARYNQEITEQLKRLGVTEYYLYN